ncbi:hypothetical protein [Undibacterium sp. WLX3042]|uniref:hypothetical protein n=1 Tax=Undibacterium sp. WLX3042 TaxID=3412686 RepID=UPI003C2B3301
MTAPRTSKQNRKEELLPLSDTEKELLKAIRVMNSDAQARVLRIAKTFALKFPASASAIAEKPAFVSIDVVKKTQSLGFEIECTLFDLVVFVESILDKIDAIGMDSLDREGAAAVNAICCFAGYADRKVKEIQHTNNRILEVVFHAIRGGQHV